VYVSWSLSSTYGGDSGNRIFVLYWRCSLIRVSVIRGSTVFTPQCYKKVKNKQRTVRRNGICSTNVDVKDVHDVLFRQHSLYLECAALDKCLCSTGSWVAQL
jgi:hypothetical protein